MNSLRAITTPQNGWGDNFTDCENGEKKEGAILMAAIEIGDLKLYTVREVAKKLKLTEITIRTYIRTGNLKAKRIGKQYLINESDLINFLTRK